MSKNKEAFDRILAFIDANPELVKEAFVKAASLPFSGPTVAELLGDELPPTSPADLEDGVPST